MIRLATPADGETLLEIYAIYVRDTAVSFETEVPSAGEFSRRIEETGRRYPYLVCQADGGIAGYAYASRHKERAAYLYDADMSIYVLPEYHGSGIAQKLYGCLFELLREQGFHSAFAGITEPNEKSRRFHEKMGFTTVGTYHKTGYKLSKWHDVTWVEKALGEYTANPGEVISIGDLPNSRIEDILKLYS